VVDVKAMDGHRRIFQVDIQIRTRTDLPARILYNWASIYTLSLKKGEHYHRLAPVISIWLLVDNLFPKVEIAHIPFFLFSREAGIQLTDHCQVHLIQLKKWRWNGSMINDKARWLRFFKEGERLDPANLPQWMRTAEMQEAMDIVTAFAKEKENHFAYLSRMDRKRVAWTLQAENDDLSEALQAAQTQIKAKQADMDRLRAERDRLKAQLIDAGLDPVGG
jgi:predicted transposase/invertase (TIGR01784 family)